MGFLPVPDAGYIPPQYCQFIVHTVSLTIALSIIYPRTEQAPMRMH